ncbi:SOS response-associated peptidase family protein [Ruminococcus flavefaciens]|uniref:SOS response-associated peptidase family protein n=1 Tax=Ruminococcus flavefaciens TaxID=1265 RepID=UPI00241824F2|nr:SOS response-associated peptidase family protein [Ruminococcus flavefaciens]
MSLRIEPKEMAEVLIKVRKMSLAQEMSIKLGKSLSMSGDLYPSDIAPVLAPNKHGKMAIFPMAWGFTHRSTPKPLANCRVETADTKALWRDSWYRRRCVIPPLGTTNMAILYMMKTVAVWSSIGIQKRLSSLFRQKALT